MATDMVRTPTETSVASTASEYTVESAMRSLENLRLEVNDEKENTNRERNGDEGDKDEVLIPGFDVIREITASAEPDSIPLGPLLLASTPRSASGHPSNPDAVVPPTTVASAATSNVPLPHRPSIASQSTPKSTVKTSRPISSSTTGSEDSGIHQYDEDVILSPGFDVIQALANTDAQSPTTPVSASQAQPRTPRPLSRDISYHRSSLPSRSPHTTVVAGLSSFSSFSGIPEEARAEPLLATSPRTPIQPASASAVASSPNTKSPIQESRAPAVKSSRTRSSSGLGNKSIPAIFHELQTVMGNPALSINLDSILDAHREADAEAEHGGDEDATGVFVLLPLER
ncbi:hypothetical protein K439DRAFT_1629158 [Ramaria rubella]|nr:hypothetical protein K439DRAFT_1629158 [Ramaria rubella]